MSSDTIKFGDYITLHGQISTSDSNKTNVYGILGTSGFTNKQVYLEVLPQQIFNTEKGKRTEKQGSGICNIKNYREYVFQVWPKLDFEAHKQQKKLLNDKSLIEREINNKKEQSEAVKPKQKGKDDDQDSTPQENYLKDIKEKLKSIKIRVKAQRENNMKQIELTKGQQLVYGTEMFLMHMDSESFLNGKVLASESDTSAYKFQLEDDFGKGMIFQIQPRYKLRKEGETIQYQDQILIYNVKLKCYLNFALGDYPIEIDKEIETKVSLPAPYYQGLDIKKSENRYRLECYLSNTNDCSWKMFFDRTHHDEDKIFRGGDLLMLKHTDKNGYLTADVSYSNKDGESELYVRKYDGEFQDEEISISSLWQIEVERQHKRGFKIPVREKDKVYSQQEESALTRVRLRHFLTGKILTLNSKEIPVLTREDYPHPQFAQKEGNNSGKTDAIKVPDHLSEIQFIATTGQKKKYIENGLCYVLKLNQNIMKVQPQMYQLHQQSDDNDKKNDSQTEKKHVEKFTDLVESMIYQPLRDSEYNCRQFKVRCFRNVQGDQNAYKLIKLDKEEEKDILFVNSTIPTLMKCIEMYKKRVQPDQSLVSRVQQTLIDLIFFTIKTDDTDPVTAEGIPIQKKQRLLQDFQMIEILMDLLYYPFYRGVYELDKLHQAEEDVVKNFRLCYRLLKHSIQEYRPNELYASQWLEFLIYQSKLTTEDCDIGAEETLTELIDNNQKILDKISNETIGQFIQMLQEEMDDKYVTLVRALCVCDGEPVEKNQITVAQYILQNSELQNELIYYVKEDERDSKQQLMIKNPYYEDPKRKRDRIKIQDIEPKGMDAYNEIKNKPEIELKKFRSYSKDIDNEEKFNFFVEIIGLLSELCLGRNYKAINTLEGLFIPQVCFKIVSDEQFGEELRGVFTQLIQSLIVDKAPYKAIALPDKLRIWTDLDGEGQKLIACSEEDCSKFDDLKEFVVRYLQANSQRRGQQQKKAENQCTYSVLELCQTMMEFGFYKSADELNSLLKHVINLIDGSCDVTNKDEENEYAMIANPQKQNQRRQSMMPSAAFDSGMGGSSGGSGNAFRLTSRYQETENNVKVHECQVLACEIIQIIAQIRHDQRVTLFLQKFKADMVGGTQKGIKGKIEEFISSPLKDKGDQNANLKDASMMEMVPMNSDKQKEDQALLGAKGLKWINEIIASNTIDINQKGKSQDQLICLHLDLTLYQSSMLKNSTFQILQELYTERKILLQELEEIQLLEDQQTIEQHSEMKKLEGNLSYYVETSENWLYVQNNTTGQNTASEIYEILDKLSNLLVMHTDSSIRNNYQEPQGQENAGGNSKNSGNNQDAGNNVDIMKNINEYRSKVKDIEVMNECLYSNPVNQKLLCNTMMYDHIFKLIKYDVEVNTQPRIKVFDDIMDFIIKGQDEDEPKSNSKNTQNSGDQSTLYQYTADKFSVVLQKCYVVLARFVYNNDYNQNLLTQYLEDIFLGHAVYIPELRVYSFLFELFKDNKAIIKSEDRVSQIVATILPVIKMLVQSNLYTLAAGYLECFKVLSNLHGRVRQKNQTIVIEQLCSRQYEKYIFITLEEKDQKKQTFVNQLAKFTQNLKEGSGQMVQVPGIIDYFNSFISLMAMMCEEKNNATESKAQHYFSLQHMQNLWKLCNDCIFVKRYITFFFYHVYLETEREMSDELESMKMKLIGNISQDIKSVGQDINRVRVQIRSFKSVISMRKVKEDYLFQALLPSVEVIMKQNFIEKPEDQQSLIQSVFETLISISQDINFNEQLRRETIKNFLAYLVTKSFFKMEEIVESFDQDFHPNKALLIRMSKRNLQITSAREWENNKNDHLTMIKAEKLNELVSAIKDHQTFQLQADMEIKSLVEIMISIEEQTKQTFKGLCTIDFKEIITEHIKFLMEDEEMDTELCVLRLLLLRKIIEFENKSENNVNTSAFDWDNDDYADYSNSIRKRQNELVDLGVVEMIVNIIQRQNLPREIFDECIMLSIAVLIGGNSKAQAAFLDELTKDVENNFLYNIKQEIMTNFQILKKTMNTFNQQLFEEIMLQQEEHKNEEDQQEKKEDGQADEDEEVEIQPEQKDNQELEDDDRDVLFFLKKIFRLLQLFCQGHNADLQSQLNEQKINGIPVSRSHNFIFMSANIFNNYIKFVNIHCIQLGDQLLDFLIEAIQGPCTENQVELCKGKIIDTCQDFLQQFKRPTDYQKVGFMEKESQNEIDFLVTKSTKLLVSLIEGDGSNDIFDMLRNNLDFDDLIFRLSNEYYKLKKRVDYIKDVFGIKDELESLNEKIGNTFDQTLMEAFNVFTLLKKIGDQDPNIKEKLTNPTTSKDNKSINDKDKGHVDEEVRNIEKAIYDDIPNAIKFFTYHTASIEISFKDSLVQIYFPVQPICRLLSVNTRQKIMQEVPRQSTNEKIQGLMSVAPEIFDELTHLADLETWIFNFSTQRLNILRDLSTLVAFTINIFMTATYRLSFKQGESNKAKFDTTSGVQVDLVIQVLGYFQLVTSSLMLVFWFFIQGPLILKKRWRECNEEETNKQDEDNKYDQEEDDRTVQSLDSVESFQILLLKGPEARIFNQGDKRNLGSNYLRIRYVWMCICFLFSQGMFKYMLFYIVCSFVGCFVSGGEIVYCWHLLDVIGRFPALQNVIKAVTTNIRQLGLTALLGLIIIYIYAILAFFFFDDTYHFDTVYDENGYAVPENVCTTLMHCYFTTINAGLIPGGGIADLIKQLSYDPDDMSRWWLRYIFDITFFLIIKMAFLNIIFGIIIDTFAELRDEKSKIDQDMKNMCFICGNDRETFDRDADGFEPHIQNDHNLWNYIYYIYNLLNQDETDYDGIESYVFEKYNKKDNAWFPILKAICLQVDVQRNQEEEIENNISQINEEMQAIITKLDDMVPHTIE